MFLFCLMVIFAWYYLTICFCFQCTECFVLFYIFWFVLVFILAYGCKSELLLDKTGRMPELVLPGSLDLENPGIIEVHNLPLRTQLRLCPDQGPTSANRCTIPAMHLCRARLHSGAVREQGQVGRLAQLHAGNSLLWKASRLVTAPPPLYQLRAFPPQQWQNHLLAELSFMNQGCSLRKEELGNPCHSAAQNVLKRLCSEFLCQNVLFYIEFTRCHLFCFLACLFTTFSWVTKPGTQGHYYDRNACGQAFILQWSLWVAVHLCAFSTSDMHCCLT